MNYENQLMITQGNESPERVELLISLTNIKSEQIVKAVTSYLVKGWAEKTIELAYDVSSSNLHRALRTINTVAAKVEHLIEMRLESVKR